MSKKGSRRKLLKRAFAESNKLNAGLLDGYVVLRIGPTATRHGSTMIVSNEYQSPDVDAGGRQSVAP